MEDSKLFSIAASIISALYGLVLALLGYLWSSHERRLRDLDHPTTGSLKATELAIVEKVHKVAASVQVQGEEFAQGHSELVERVARLEEMRREVVEIKTAVERNEQRNEQHQREMRDLMVRILVKIGGSVP